MICTPEEAAKKYCMSDSEAAHSDRAVGGSFCISVLCMHWNKFDAERGYCGLSGVDWHDAARATTATLVKPDTAEKKPSTYDVDSVFNYEGPGD